MSQQSSPTRKTVKVYCGELCQSNSCSSDELNLLNMNLGNIEANITVGLDSFVKETEMLPDRVIDLLQIASYVYCADRLINRGDRESLSNCGWDRSFDFHIPVLDIEFWSTEKVRKALNDALIFMTGDRSYSFDFYKATINPIEKDNQQLSLFSTGPGAEINEKTDIMLFSGGLDSLAGAIERLNSFENRNLCLVSHRSNKVTMHTQNVIVEHLKNKYNGRVSTYGFECHNKKSAPSRDETQRTRMFLFSAIAFAICSYYGKKELYIYENGITSINLSKQMDVINARASRTTHPKTIGLLRSFFKLFDQSFDIIVPYYNKTKTEILEIFDKFKETDIISSSVSCSSTRNKPRTESTHCGCCSQCIDRIFAVFASGLSEYDTTYSEDFIHHIPNAEVKQRLYNTIQLAQLEPSAQSFFESHPDELMDVIEYWPSDNPDDCLDEIYYLFCRFQESIVRAIKGIQQEYDNPLTQLPENSFLRMVSDRDYLQTPVERRVAQIDSMLKQAIPLTFQRERPKNENDFNDKIQGLLRMRGAFSREYPCLQFGITNYRADHGQNGLIIEAKYIRENTTPSVASEGIAADITKIPAEISGVMFVVYDPERSIKDDEAYISSFEIKRSGCFVRIYR